MPTHPPNSAGRRPRHVEGWDLFEFDQLASTNDQAASFPAWTAVRADRQDSGRGRHGRRWESGPGGLWFSAVVPTTPSGRGWGALPLVAGCVTCETLAAFGAAPLHLRWPNDVMSGRRKLAGLLVDQFQPGRAVVGIGINIRNDPASDCPELAGTTVRMADFPGYDDTDDAPRAIWIRLLLGLRSAMEAMQGGGFDALLPRVNRWWPTAAVVEIETEEGRIEGVFLGVDAEGRLRIRAVGGDGDETIFEAHRILRLREVEGNS